MRAGGSVAPSRSAFGRTLGETEVGHYAPVKPHRADATRVPPAFRAAVVALVLAGHGCVHLTQTIVIRPNGSGTVTYRYSVAEEHLANLATGRRVIEQWQGAAPGAGVLRLNWILNEAAAERHFSGEGVKLKHYRIRSRNGRRVVDVVVYLADAAEALRSARFGDFDLSSLEAGITRLRATIAGTAEQPAVSPAQLAELRALCAGLRLVLKVQVPGKIVETTAHTVEGTTATWIFDAAGDPGFLAETPVIDLAFADGSDAD